MADADYNAEEAAGMFGLRWGPLPTLAVPREYQI